MKNVYFFLLFIFLFLAMANAQEQNVKIVKIYSNNWFETEDGRILRLANVELPSVNDPDSLRRWVANKIQQYAKRNLLGRNCVILVDSSQMKVGAPLRVHLFKKYPLQKLNINKLFLEWGYGWYVPPARGKFAKIYAAAERKAKRWKKGLWMARKNFPGKAKKVYSLYFIRGNKNIFSGVEAFRGVGYLMFTRFPESVFDLNFGFVQNAKKVTSCYDCYYPDYYIEYLGYFKTGYLQIVYGRKWKRFTLSLGGLAYMSGDISDNPLYHLRVGFSPIVVFRYRWQNTYFAKIALTDNYALIYKDYPVTLSFGRDFKSLHSKMWLGAVREKAHLGLLAGWNVYAGPYVLLSNFGYMPSAEKWLAQVQIGIYVR